MIRAGIDPYLPADLPTERWYAVGAHGQQLWHSCAFLLRRSLLGSGWDERFGCASDTEIIWRALEQPGVVAHRPYVGVYYRILPDSVSGTFRRNAWLEWEGVAGNLLTLHRYRRTRGHLPPALRLRYAHLWSRWQAALPTNRARIPPAIFEKLSSVVAGVEPPSLADRALLRIRNAVRRA